MQPFPHQYSVAARAAAQGETLMVAAVADCFVLTFRGIAGVSRFSWLSVECSVTGTVDRVERVTQFTALEVRARLRVPAGANEDQARRLLAKAEETCLVSNSLKVRPHLDAGVEVEAAGSSADTGS